MTRLSVNVNKLATLRNSRGANLPDLKKMTLDIERFGAQGITMHPRPDERHIRFQDLYDIVPALTTEFNIEGYPSEHFLKLVQDIRPAQTTLVPDPPHVLTSNAGWQVKNNEMLLAPLIDRLKSMGTRVSLFIDPHSIQDSEFHLMKKLGVDRIELYTEAYASHFGTARQAATTQSYKIAALKAQELGLGVNAGHDLNTQNLAHLVQEIPFLSEVSIGHALICDALYWGMEITIKKYLECLSDLNK